MPYKSGLCDIGCHEGDNPKNFRGQALPTCTSGSEGCSCECHKKFDEMFSMTGQERTVVNFSGYVPDKGSFVMPDLAQLALDRKLSDETRPVEIIASPVPDLVPTGIEQKFSSTPTGRAARGELEQMVDRVCRDWAVDQEDFPCRVTYVADQIERREGIKRPSEGAINAVFERWQKIGYAIIERKPNRFVSYTDAAREHGLLRLKELAKRSKAK